MKYPLVDSHIGTRDPLIDDNLRFFEKLNKFKNHNYSTLYVYENLIHCMLNIIKPKWIDSFTYYSNFIRSFQI